MPPVPRTWGPGTRLKPAIPLNSQYLWATYNNQNQVTGAPNATGGFPYDLAGNVTSDGVDQYTYDAEGRISSARGTAYTYDGASERVAKTGTLYWKGTGSEALVESSATNTNPTRYIFFNGKRIARLDPGATTAKYYVQDNVGSTALVTDYLGNPLSESLFFPYGGEQAILSNDSNTYKFTGKQRDPETGLDDFGARYYASNLGRFMSPDWAAKPVTVPYASFGDPQTLNLYSYVENGPLNRVDADGHAASQGGDNNWVETVNVNGGDVEPVSELGILGLAGDNPNVGGDSMDSDTCCTAEEIAHFVAAGINAFTSDFLFGADRMNDDTDAGKLGAATGDSAALIMGGMEAGEGAATVGAGAVACSTGGGCAAGAPAIAAGAVGTVHGSTAVYEAATHLAASALGPYSRPNNATTKEQRESVQGKPCETCGATGQKNVANHKDPLVEQHYRGGIDKGKMHDPNAVGPQCQSCSSQQGGFLKGFSSAMKKLFGF